MRGLPARDCNRSSELALFAESVGVVRHQNVEPQVDRREGRILFLELVDCFVEIRPCAVCVSDLVTKRADDGIIFLHPIGMGAEEASSVLNSRKPSDGIGVGAFRFFAILVDDDACIEVAAGVAKQTQRQGPYATSTRLPGIGKETDVGLEQWCRNEGLETLRLNQRRKSVEECSSLVFLWQEIHRSAVSSRRSSLSNAIDERYLTLDIAQLDRWPREGIVSLPEGAVHRVAQAVWLPSECAALVATSEVSLRCRVVTRSSSAPISE